MFKLLTLWIRALNRLWVRWKKNRQQTIHNTVWEFSELSNFIVLITNSVKSAGWRHDNQLDQWSQFQRFSSLDCHLVCSLTSKHGWIWDIIFHSAGDAINVRSIYKIAEFLANFYVKLVEVRMTMVLTISNYIEVTVHDSSVSMKTHKFTRSKSFSLPKFQWIALYDFSDFVVVFYQPAEAAAHPKDDPITGVKPKTTETTIRQTANAFILPFVSSCIRQNRHANAGECVRQEKNSCYDWLVTHN